MNVHGVTILHCEGFGRRAANDLSHYLDEEAEIGFTPKTKLEIVSLDEDMAKIVQTIRENAHTGHFVEGKIFVPPIEQATDIHSDASGEGVV